MDSSPPGSPVPGILQARTLEWGAIAFSVIQGRGPSNLDLIQGLSIVYLKYKYVWSTYYIQDMEL